MVTRQLEVRNELGLHARVAAKITREMKKFESSVTVKKDGNAYNLKNVTGVIMSNAKKGDILTVEFEGPDEKFAAESVAGLFADKFGEK